MVRVLPVAKECPPVARRRVECSKVRFPPNRLHLQHPNRVQRYHRQRPALSRAGVTKC